MPLQSSYIEEEKRLDLSFAGNLDITLSREICGLCRQPTGRLNTCILNLSSVQQIFDSGLALMQMLYRRLKALCATVVILTEHPRVRECIPMITGAKAEART